MTIKNKKRTRPSLENILQNDFPLDIEEVDPMALGLTTGNIDMVLSNV